jgi:hypothetical protein
MVVLFTIFVPPNRLFPCVSATSFFPFQPACYGVGDGRGDEVGYASVASVCDLGFAFSI